jgi:ABC-type transport system involved in cytochrome c biogenesis permease subunit
MFSIPRHRNTAPTSFPKPTKLHATYLPLSTVGSAFQSACWIATAVFLKDYDQEALVAHIYYDGNAEASVSVVLHQGSRK